MTIIEAVNRIDLIKPNNYTQIDKIKWLSDLDGRIKAEIIDTHEGGEDVVFNGYTEFTPLDTSLLATGQYDDLYVKWLESQIDYTNAEYQHYNNSVTAFNNLYSAFERYYNRQHMPKTQKLKFF